MRQGRTRFEDEGPCADLAGRIALSFHSGGRKKKGLPSALTAGILIESDQFITAMTPTIEAFRKEMFKTAKPPFPKSLTKAARWIEKEAKLGSCTSMRNKKRGGKLVVKIMKDIDVCNQLLGAEYRLGQVFRQIHYLKHVQENGKQMRQVMKIEVKPYSKVGELESMTRKLRMEPQVRRLVLDGLMTDESWHNNAAAHFEYRMSNGKILLLWIAEADPAEREHEDMPHHTVELAGKEGTGDADKQQLLTTEDTDAACRYVRQLIEDDLKLASCTDATIH